MPSSKILKINGSSKEEILELIKKGELTESMQTEMLDLLVDAVDTNVMLITNFADDSGMERTSASITRMSDLSLYSEVIGMAQEINGYSEKLKEQNSRSIKSSIDAVRDNCETVIGQLQDMLRDVENSDRHGSIMKQVEGS